MFYRLFKNILFTVIILCILTLSIELVTRIAIFVYSKDTSSFFYGIDKSIKIRSQNRIVTFYRLMDVERIDTDAAETQKRSVDKIIMVAAFGGSTTRGYNCSLDSSSWPEELEKIWNTRISKPKVRVKNFGADGSDSDYAVEQLPLSNTDGRLRAVLWANFVNESDIIFKGPGKNIKELSDSFEDILLERKIYFKSYKLKLILFGLDKSVTKYSLFYWSLKKLTQYLQVKFPKEVNTLFTMEKWNEAKITDRLISMALTNYKINFIKACDFCKKNRIKLVIVRLPSRTGGDREKQDLNIHQKFIASFRKELDSLMVQLSKSHEVPLVNVNEKYITTKIPPGVFCDGAHQKLKGHRLTGKIIFSELLSYLGGEIGN